MMDRPNIKSVRWPLIGGLLHLAHQGIMDKIATGHFPLPCTECNNPSTRDHCWLPVTILLCNGNLLRVCTCPSNG